MCFSKSIKNTGVYNQKSFVLERCFHLHVYYLFKINFIKKKKNIKIIKIYENAWFTIFSIWPLVPCEIDDFEEPLKKHYVLANFWSTRLKFMCLTPYSHFCYWSPVILMILKIKKKKNVKITGDQRTKLAETLTAFEQDAI